MDHQLRHHEAETIEAPASNGDGDLYVKDYDQRHETVTQPGYYDTAETYNVETLVYDAETGERLWWAVSETVNPDTVDQAIHEIAEATAKRMKDERVIR